MDYKYTINLPQTKFQMKGNLPQTEPHRLKHWNVKYKQHIFRKKNFILNDGPPYANGDIHIGHAFNKIMKDITCKSKYLMGYNVSFIPGWDCHGLPIELNVEKTIKNKDKNFRTACKTYAESQIQIQMKSFKRLGIFGDWDNSYKTMDKSFESSIVESFTQMLKKKYIYSGYKPNYWCFDCKSALAESEVEYQEKESHSIYLYFEIISPNHISNKKIGLIAWTTTPWTIPFNSALAINKNYNYIIIEKNEIQYILSEELLIKTTEHIEFNTYKIIKKIDPKVLEGMYVKHPIYDKNIPIVFSTHVKNDSGTGCVHIAPAYGHDDYKIGLKYKLDIKNNIDENGYFYNNTEEFSLLFYTKINSIVINILKTKNILLMHNMIKHRYPHCWRHKSPLIFRTTEQWFLNLSNMSLKNKIHYFIENHMQFIPKNGYSKIKSMLKDRIDWCISRQRYWGIPIMLFLDKNKKIHPATIDILNKIKEHVKIHGTDFWYYNDPFKLLNVDKSIYSKLDDVLDVWFDSSSVYKYLYDQYKYNIPYDLCIEGSDQYRGWFQVSIINAIAVHSQMPYKKIISHGFILDQKGRKMSKSLNNVISPDDIIKKYGAEILRLWVSSTNYNTDISISSEIIDRICDIYKKIRNTLKFLIANTQNIEKARILENSTCLLLDEWIVFKIYIFKKNVLKEYNDYKFNSAYQKIYKLCINELGSKYLDLIKDRLYTINEEAQSKSSAKTACFYILYNIIKIISPILSFTSDETWEHLKFKEKESIFESLYNTDLIILNSLKTQKIKNYIMIDKLFKIKNKINKNIEIIKNNKNIGGLLEIDLRILCNIYWFYTLEKIKKELHLFFQTSKTTLKKDKKYNTSLKVYINKTQNIKCERCWHRILKSKHIKICIRCINNIYYEHEIRTFI